MPLFHTQSDISLSVCVSCVCVCVCWVGARTMACQWMCVPLLYVCMSSPSAIPQFSGALRLINSSGAVGDVGVEAAIFIPLRLNWEIRHYKGKVCGCIHMCAWVYCSSGKWRALSPSRPHCYSLNCIQGRSGTKDIEQDLSFSLSLWASCLHWCCHWTSPSLSARFFGSMPGLSCSLFTPAFPSKVFILQSLLEIPFHFSLLTFVFPVFPDFAHSSSLFHSQCVFVCLFVRFHRPQFSFYCRKSIAGNYKKQVKQYILCLHRPTANISELYLSPTVKHLL